MERYSKFKLAWNRDIGIFQIQLTLGTITYFKLFTTKVVHYYYVSPFSVKTHIQQLGLGCSMDITTHLT